MNEGADTSNVVTETDPPLSDVLVVQIGLGSLDFVFVLEQNNAVARVLAFEHLDEDILLGDIECLEELNDLRFLGVPREPSNLDSSISVVVVDHSS